MPEGPVEKLDELVRKVGSVQGAVLALERQLRELELLQQAMVESLAYLTSQDEELKKLRKDHDALELVNGKLVKRVEGISEVQNVLTQKVAVLERKIERVVKLEETLEAHDQHLDRLEDHDKARSLLLDGLNAKVDDLRKRFLAHQENSTIHRHDFPDGGQEPFPQVARAEQGGGALGCGCLIQEDHFRLCRSHQVHLTRVVNDNLRMQRNSMQKALNELEPDDD